ncbi:MAG: carboxyl-terminal processing protease [Ancylomarina sp.]|jgi:carboxyl-terminal processing protease
MKIFKKNGILLILAALLLSSALFFGFNRDEKNFEISKNLNIYHTLFRELNMFYVDEIDSGDLIKKSMDAMLSSLDPYTTYIPESEMEDFKLMTTGEYAGIGSLITKHGDNIVVAEPYKDLPADKAGLKAGDVFIEINGVKIKTKSTSDVSNLLKGQANKPLTIKVRRPGVNKLIEKEVVRAEIQLKSVPYHGMLADSIGYINLKQFTNKASGEVRNALRELKDKNAKSIILDLRGNPGGLLDQAVNIVNLFVEKGEVIVSTKGKVSQWDKTYKADKVPMDTETPIAILVNRGSASASEIVSGAIQDLDRGIVVGQRTFGKGLVQTTRNLSYNSKLKVTTAKYYIPSGRCIQALDYSHRNKDGSVGKVPDTLISEFKTKNGRKVFDGGGILPDVKVEMDFFSSLSVGLIRKYKVFDYATIFANKHAEIADAKSFELSDKDYEDFKQFLKTEKFEYESESTEILEALKKAAKEEKYFSIAKSEFDNISAKLTPNLDRDLKMFEKEIKTLLTHEIIKRYHYQIGGILYALRDDKVLKEAISTLKDQKKYREILKK